MLLFFFACFSKQPCPTSYPASHHRLQTPDGVISYRVFGSGNTLLVINGGFGRDSFGFETLAQQLAKEHRVILFDRRGLGRSALHNNQKEQHTFEKLGADLELLRDAVAVDSWDVLGHSFGGMLAAYYASVYPDRVNKLVLSSSSGIDLRLFDQAAHTHIKARLSDTDKKEIEELETRHKQGDKDPGIQERFTQIIARAYVYEDEHAPIISSWIARSDPQVGRWITEDLKRIEFDVAPQLRTFHKPALVLHGEYDVMPRTISEYIHQTLPSSELVVLPNIGHYGWIEDPQAYQYFVLGFLRE